MNISPGLAAKLNEVNDKFFAKLTISLTVYEYINTSIPSGSVDTYSL